MSDSVRPHRWQPTRFWHPWDSPGKNTGVGCPFLLGCMKVKSESEVAQLCPTLHDPMDCSLPGSSAHGIFQVRVLEWVAIAFSTLCYNIPKTLWKKLTYKLIYSFRWMESCNSFIQQTSTKYLLNVNIVQGTGGTVVSKTCESSSLGMYSLVGRRHKSNNYTVI